MSRRKLLDRHEQVVLFQYVAEGKPLPKWANTQLQVFARLMNLTERQAEKAYERAYHAGWLSKGESQ